MPYLWNIFLLVFMLVIVGNVGERQFLSGLFAFGPEKRNGELCSYALIFSSISWMGTVSRVNYQHNFE